MICGINLNCSMNTAIPRLAAPIIFMNVKYLDHRLPSFAHLKLIVPVFCSLICVFIAGILLCRCNDLLKLGANHQTLFLNRSARNVCRGCPVS